MNPGNTVERTLGYLQYMVMLFSLYNTVSKYSAVHMLRVTKKLQFIVMNSHQDRCTVMSTANNISYSEWEISP